MAGSDRPKTYSVFVGLVAPTVTKDDMFELFRPYGDIHEVHRVSPKPDQNYTYCFVRYKSRVSADKAVEELNNWPVAGFRLKVEIAAESGGNLRSRKITTPESKQALPLETSWMKELAELMGSEKECVSYLYEINNRTASAVSGFGWDGSRRKLDLGKLDEAGKHHRTQKIQTREVRFTPHKSVREITNRKDLSGVETKKESPTQLADVSCNEDKESGVTNKKTEQETTLVEKQPKNIQIKNIQDSVTKTEERGNILNNMRPPNIPRLNKEGHLKNIPDEKPLQDDKTRRAKSVDDIEKRLEIISKETIEEQNRQYRFEANASKHHLWKLVRPDLFENQENKAVSSKTDLYAKKYLKKSQSEGNVVLQPQEVSPPGNSGYVSDDITNAHTGHTGYRKHHSHNHKKCLGHRLNEKCAQQKPDQFSVQQYLSSIGRGHSPTSPR